MNTETYINNIPTELKAQKIWGLWDLETRNGKTTKVPYNAMTNKRAKSNDPSTWCGFEQAITALKEHKRKGLAIFLGGGLCGLDVDHVDPELTKYEKDPKSDNLVNRLKDLTNNSYMEISQSGAGIHVLFKGYLPDNVNNHPKDKPFELYSKERFFALTGNLLTESSYKLLDGEQVLKLVNSTVGMKKKRSQTSGTSQNDLSTDEIVNKILSSDQGVKFKRLMDGDLTDYDDDNSSADIALCNILAFWTNRDPEKMDEIFRKSKLYRPEKWDKKHHSDGSTYGQGTIQRAIEDTPRGYNVVHFPVSSSSDTSNVITIRNRNDNTLAELQHKPTTPNDWTRFFILKKKSNGEFEGIKTTATKNALLIINNDPNIKGLFKFNEFTQNVEVCKDKTINLTKWGSGVIKFYKGSLKDIDVNNLGIYIESYPKYHVTFKAQLIYDAIEASARQHSFNPIVDYMNECKKNWDGKRRLDDFFPIYLGAEKSITTSLITRLWFMGGVAKAYNPTAKFDYVLDIVGGQGTGKTTLLQKIAPLGMYTDQFTSFTDRDDLANMKDAFIVNDDEMDASNKCGFAEVKKFITLQRFKYRKPYGRISEEYPKHFIIARTTNEKAHLKDRSGDRRFMTILVNPKEQKKYPYQDLTDEYVKQLWGEAIHLYETTKDPFNLGETDEKLLKANREQFIQTTALEDSLYETLENDFKGKPYIVPSDLAFKMFNDENYFVTHKAESKNINYYMEHLGYKKVPVRINNGKQKKVFKFIGE